MGNLRQPFCARRLTVLILAAFTALSAAQNAAIASGRRKAFTRLPPTASSTGTRRTITPTAITTLLAPHRSMAATLSARNESSIKSRHLAQRRFGFRRWSWMPTARFTATRADILMAWIRTGARCQICSTSSRRRTRKSCSSLMTSFAITATTWFKTP